MRRHEVSRRYLEPPYIHTQGQAETNMCPLLRKMTIYNPNVDLVNDNVYTKFGKILCIHSQDIEKKTNKLFRNYRFTGQAKSSIAHTFSKRG